MTTKKIYIMEIEILKIIGFNIKPTIICYLEQLNELFGVVKKLPLK